MHSVQFQQVASAGGFKTRVSPADETSSREFDHRTDIRIALTLFFIVNIVDEENQPVGVLIRRSHPDKEADCIRQVFAL